MNETPQGKNSGVFRQEYLGEWVESRCDVRDGSGGRCPEKPEHFLGKQVGLCRRCYLNYQEGAFQVRDRNGFFIGGRNVEQYGRHHQKPGNWSEKGSRGHIPKSNRRWYETENNDEPRALKKRARQQAETEIREEMAVDRNGTESTSEDH